VQIRSDNNQTPNAAYMTESDRFAGHRLLEVGVGVPFRVLGHEILPALDEAEFGIRLELKLGADGEDGDDAGDPEDLVEWAAFGFMFVLGLLAFEDARPRELSALEYRERDELSVSDFFEGLRFRGGALHFQADYIRGRRDGYHRSLGRFSHRHDGRSRKGALAVARPAEGKESDARRWRRAARSSLMAWTRRD
jgi:hypothetical protein